MWDYGQYLPTKDEIFEEKKEIFHKYIYSVNNAENLAEVINKVRAMEEEYFEYDYHVYNSKIGESDIVNKEEKILPYILEYCDRSKIIEKINEEEDISKLGEFLHLTSINREWSSFTTKFLLERIDNNLLHKKLKSEHHIDKIVKFFEIFSERSLHDITFLESLVKNTDVSKFIDFLNRETDLSKIGSYIQILGNRSKYFLSEITQNLDKENLIRKNKSETDLINILYFLDYLSFCLFSQKSEKNFEEEIIKKININKIIKKLRKEYSQQKGIDILEWEGLLARYWDIISGLLNKTNLEWLNTELRLPRRESREYEY